MAFILPALIEAYGKNNYMSNCQTQFDLSITPTPEDDKGSKYLWILDNDRRYD